MADTFDRLLALRPPRPSIDPGRGTIVIEAVDPFHSFNEHSCRVEVDGRRWTMLYAFRTGAIVEVDAGEHEVSVQLGREVPSTLPIRVEPGGRVDLICGKKPEWIAFEMRFTRRMLVQYLACIGLGGIAWLSYPLLRTLVLATMYQLEFQGGFASLCHKLVMIRIATAGIVLFACYVPSLIVLAIRYYQEARWLRAQIGPTCFIAIRPREAIESNAPNLARLAKWIRGWRRFKGLRQSLRPSQPS